MSHFGGSLGSLSHSRSSAGSQETRSPVSKLRTLDFGLWTLNFGRASDFGLWTLDFGRSGFPVNSLSLRASDFELWTLDFGLRTLDFGLRALRFSRKLVDVLVLDDWGLARLTALQQRDVLELLEDRHQRRSTIATSQLPLSSWHEAMANPTLAQSAHQTSTGLGH